MDEDVEMKRAARTGRRAPRRSGRSSAMLLLPLLALALAACGASAAGSGQPGGDPGTSSNPTTSSQVGTSVTSSPPSTTSTVPATQRLQQPTPAHPLSILEIGDSLGEDLGFGLADVFSSNPLVHVIQAAKGDTGLARPDYYNWQAQVPTELQEYHPGVLIVFLGANDGQNFVENGQYASFGGATWHRLYSARVAAVMSEAVAAGTRVLWVGMPIMQDPSFAGEMEQLNSIFAAEAATHPGVVYFSSWPVLANAAGQYVESINGVLLRDSDGIHMANGGDDRLATALIAPMERAWGINLTVSGA